MRGWGLLLVAAIGTLHSLCWLAEAAFDLNELPEEACGERGHVAATQSAAGPRLPALFDFTNYKRQFGKHYGSFIEELDRKRLYLSRALRAVASALSYKLYKSTSYNAINELSDMSAAELDKMANRALAASLRREAHSAAGADGQGEGLARDDGHKLPEFVVHEGESLEEEVGELMREHGHESDYKELLSLMLQQAEHKRRARNKRQLSPESEHTSGMPVRDLPLENLLHTAEWANNGASFKLTRHVDTNNPSYEPVELHSFGLTDQQEDVERLELGASDDRPLSKQIASYLKAVRHKQAGLFRKFTSGGAGGGKPDQVYYDLRQTDCFAPVRRQNKCGACYAFAATAIMEWLYCKQTGKLVEFSEQYMIDCGRDRFENLVARGCHGGDVFATAKFVHNFGMETRLNYCYKGADGLCPYSEQQDLKKTGYIRMEIGRLLRVHMRHWPAYIKRGPLYVTVQTGLSRDIFEYGGGVDQCNYCLKHQGYHAMVLVGHGRESGEEYWLLRNSYGPTWGEHGHWKLSKRAAEKFVHAAVGWMYGTTRDGSALGFEARLTDRELGEPLKRMAPPAPTAQRAPRPNAHEAQLNDSGRPLPASQHAELSSLKW